MLFHDVHAFDEHATSLREGSEHLALLAAIFAAHDAHCVALRHPHFHTLGIDPVPGSAPLSSGLPVLERPHSYKTSGASETIFMYFFSRSSRATGPKMRVGVCSPASLMIPTAFSSKRIYEPSLRRVSFAVRTTTARATSD